jgi:hypothetical protein
LKYGLYQFFVFPSQPTKKNRDVIAFLGSEGPLDWQAKVAEARSTAHNFG